MEQLNLYFDRPDELDKAVARFDSSRMVLVKDALLPTSRSELLATLIGSVFIPALDAAEEAGWRATCDDRLKMITLAMLIHEKQKGHLPPAYTVDKNGKPLHSWRVLLLPYLGNKDAKKLYDQIKLDEPWDSTHNKKFHDAAIEFYQCPSAELKPGQTTYSVVVGKKTAFQPGEGKKLDQFGPNSTRMILVLETNTPACWMDPKADLDETITSLDSPHPGSTNTGLRNGSVQGISHSIEPEKLKQGIEGTDKEWCNGEE